MMRTTHLLLLASVICQCAVPAVAAEALHVRSAWVGGAVPGPAGGESYCAREAKFEAGATVAIAETHGGSLTLVTRTPSARTRAPARATIAFRGGAKEYETAVDPKIIEHTAKSVLTAYALPDDGDAAKALAGATMLTIGAAPLEDRYEIVAGAAALTKLHACAAGL